MFLVSCISNYITVDINHFKIDNEILKDGALVQVLSFSGMPDINENVDHYIHMIIVSLESNDTINFLTIKPAGILSDEDKIMNYFSENSLIYQDILTSLESQNSGRLNKVIVSKDFQTDINNSYPTVIGILGNVTK